MERRAKCHERSTSALAGSASNASVRPQGTHSAHTVRCTVCISQCEIPEQLPWRVQPSAVRRAKDYSPGKNPLRHDSGGALKVQHEVRCVPCDALKAVSVLRCSGRRHGWEQNGVSFCDTGGKATAGDRPVGGVTSRNRGYAAPVSIPPLECLISCMAPVSIPPHDSSLHSSSQA